MGPQPTEVIRGAGRGCRLAERQRERRVSDRRLARSLTRLIKALERGLAALDQAIDAQVRACPAWREEDLLACVRGVGPVTARTLLAEMPELGSLDRRAVASLALAPIPASPATGAATA